MLNFFLNFLQKRQNLSAACEKGTVFVEIFWPNLPLKFIAKHLFSQNSFFPRKKFSVPEKMCKTRANALGSLKIFEISYFRENGKSHFRFNIHYRCTVLKGFCEKHRVRFSSALLNHWRPLADEYIRSLQSTQS
jgi:hypothetical protein